MVEQIIKINIISIHAPSRERLYIPYHTGLLRYFNPRSLAGATSLTKYFSL